MQTSIKTQSKTIASLLAASLVALTLGTAAAHAAEAGDPLTKTIAYGDLNLETADGARVLYARVRDAAHAVCSPFEGRENQGLAPELNNDEVGRRGGATRGASPPPLARDFK